MAVQVRALGPLELDGASATSGNARRALAALLVRRGSVVAADTLAEIVWGDGPPRNVEAALQTVVSRLRAVLRAAGLGDALRTRSPGYVLELDPGSFDVTVFTELAGRGRALLATDPSAATRQLDEALRLWRGPAYLEFADDAFAAAEIAGLTEARFGALEDRAEAALKLGRPQEAVPPLERVVAEAPMRERPQAQLMLALYRTGRQVEALDVYRRYRDLLDEELGLEPQADLRELEGRILRQDPGLLGPFAPVAGNLPAARTALVGRDAPLTDIVTRLGAGRVLTLTGPGGVGKTRLALAAAHEAAAGFPGGGWLVELASLLRTGSVAAATLTALDVHVADTAGPLERLVGYLRRERLLLVLDNCEHVVDDAARVVQRIVDSCPGVTVLTTSRVPLGVEPEHLVPVQPLVDDSDAVRLFVDRAQAVVPAFDPADASLDTVGELCRRLDGMPLAIELAAGRMRYMTPAEMLNRLPDRLTLRNPHRLASERHQTLRAVVDWSYQLLEPADQRLFERLSVFAGGFGAGDAAAVCALDPVTAVERVGELVDRSMVVATADSSWQTTSFALLETLRDFGRERLAARDETGVVFRAHAEHLLALLGQGPEKVLSRECGAWMAQVAERMDDLGAAHAWAMDHDLTLALRLTAGLSTWVGLQMHVDILGWCETGFAAWDDHGDPADTVLAAMTLAVAADCASFRSDHSQATSLSLRSLELLKDRPERAFPLSVLGALGLLLGDLDLVRDTSEEIFRIGPAAGDHLLCYAHVVLVLARAYGGDHDRAVADAQAFLARGRSPLELAWGRYILGEALLDTDPPRAAILLEQAFTGAKATNDRLVYGASLTSLASVKMRHGDPRDAVPLYRKAVEHWHRNGNWLQQWTSIRGVLFLFMALGEPGWAAILLAAIDHQESANEPYGPDAERVAEVRARLAADLPPAELAELTIRGARMDAPEILAFALGRLSA
ncbi:BTAD domain-containing putative transcriptional regulator [Herbidospora mongoliensis]|uniref:BTAD domain-containing putative transcriptional regulator n=1 Tax=Herbidospora mongoliensis TaxID=688067 RepID=UPI000833B2A8|nr:BTAD domain-containing putative transcriptional regulator [Herbidospora mongoliensis]